jgi:membrane fusion protein (multidrug efflux system)
VRVADRILEGALAVPARAFQEQQGVTSVLVVSKGDQVEARQVQVGDRSGDLWVVTAGLAAGERVIVEGLTKAAPGRAVKPEEVSLESVSGGAAAAAAAPGSGAPDSPPSATAPPARVSAPPKGTGSL